MQALKNNFLFKLDSLYQKTIIKFFLKNNLLFKVNGLY
jgi:hypothetical protein